MLRMGLGLLLASTVACAAAHTGRTAHELVALVRDALKAGQSDGKLAGELRSFRLVEHLDDHAIEELVSVGAGPKVEEELDRLRDLSTGQPEADLSADFPHGPAPVAAQQQFIINTARNQALAYSRSLPDFFCEEMVRRFENFRGNWHQKDTLEIKLTYFEKREKYELVRLNGRQTVRSLESVGGSMSQGEFGSLLASLFAADSSTRFRWDHWTTLRGRLAHVFQFRILATHSINHLEVEIIGGARLSTVTGQHGFVYIDRDSNAVLKILADADSIPRSFPVRTAHTVLDFGFTDVGGQEFLLPLRAEVRLGSDSVLTKNEVDFLNYRKFGTESTVTFH